MLKFVTAYLWALALGKVLGIEPPLPGYSVEVVQSEVLVNLKGLLVTLNGTVQQVYQQILEINPEYHEEFGPVWNTTTPTPDEIWRANFAAGRRETWSDCGHWDPARAEAIWEGINHLNHVSGRPMSKPGPGVCGRVSCSYDSAIWWCNDGFEEKSLSSYHDIASSVQALTMNCTYWSDNHLEPQVSGQQFHVDKWSTIVKGAVC